MEIPKDKLPLIRGRLLYYGQYSIMCKDPKLTEFQTNKHAGQIVYKDLSKYVVTATNNFHKAIELLEYFTKRVEEGSIRSKTTYNKYKEFLKFLEEDGK